jgi:hypothetical protein
MIYQATHLVNFAQGEMAMFATYIAWTLINAGMPYWAAFFLTVGFAFVFGVVIERVVIRPVENAPVLAVVVGVHRAAGDPEQRHRLDLYVHDQDVPEPVPEGDRPRQVHVAARSRARSA